MSLQVFPASIMNISIINNKTANRKLASHTNNSNKNQRIRKKTVTVCLQQSAIGSIIQAPQPKTTTANQKIKY